MNDLNDILIGIIEINNVLTESENTLRNTIMPSNEFIAVVEAMGDCIETKKVFKDMLNGLLILN